MSANTTIQEGGKDYPFGPVKCLMVEGDNGEFYPWYPEADRALDSLSVDKNGIYRASERGVYGWNRVSVNVAQADRVTGRDPDTGEEKTVTVDPETGELVETVVPVEIRIETPPTFTGPYGDGAYIDFTGLTVAAYGANGDKMLDVPFNELIFPVTVTDYSKATGEENVYTKDGITALGIANDTYRPNRAGNYVSAPLYMYQDHEVMGTTAEAQIAYVTQYNGNQKSLACGGVMVVCRETLIQTTFTARILLSPALTIYTSLQSSIINLPARGR